MRTEPTVKARRDDKNTESSSGRPPVPGESVPSRRSGHIVALAHLTSKPPLAGQAQRSLARRAQTGEKRARDRLVETNMRLVVSIASKYRGEGMEFEDLVSEGVTGLLEGIRRFEPHKGYQLSTYVTFWIRRAILQAWAWQSRNLRLPRGVNDDLHKLARASEDLRDNLGRRPSTGQLARATGLSHARVEELLKARRHPVSLDAPAGGSGSEMEVGEKSTLVELLAAGDES